MDEKESTFQKIFASHIINIDHLREVSYGGIPRKYRAATWRILLGTQGLNVKNMQKSIEAKNTKYLRSMLKVGADRASSGVETSKCTRAEAGCGGDAEKTGSAERSQLFQTREALLDRRGPRICRKHSHQIDIDIRRLACTHRTFLQADISFLFQNILTVVAVRRPAIGYVQGMADILSPFIQVFCTEDTGTAESSAFYAFSKFIDTVQANFIEGQPGIRRSISDLESAVAKADPELFGKLKSAGIKTHMYAFRWFNCFFVREFDMENAYLLFDSIFSHEDPSRYSVFFGAALLITDRSAIMCSSFEEILVFLQSLPCRKRTLHDMAVLFRLARLLEKGTGSAV